MMNDDDEVLSLETDALNQIESELGLTLEESVIPDDFPTHILNNGAFVQIADTPPITPDEYDEAYGLTPEDEPTDPQEGVDREHVLGGIGVGGAHVYTRGGDILRGSDTSDHLFRDDFDELVRRQAKAAVGPNGEML